MVRLLSFPIPCIAAINGHAYGGGLAFAFSHDYRIMRQDRGLFFFEIFCNLLLKLLKGWVCIPAVRIGIVLPPAFSLLVQSKTSAKLAREIILEGKKFDGKEAEKLGIVDKSGKF